MSRNKRLIHNCGLTFLLFSVIVCGFSVCSKPGGEQKVHALLIILGNDDVIRASVEQNQQQVTGLLRQVSRSCEVHLTVMKSNPGFDGEVIETVLVDSEVTSRKSPRQLDIITPQQVKEWVQTVPTSPADTVLVYYSGHGSLDEYGTHDLRFALAPRSLTLTRAWLAEELRAKSAGLKMLITDTCSEQVGQEGPSARQPIAFVDLKPNAKFYVKHLFLEHNGFLDITAASPGQRAYGHYQIGGFFTKALVDGLIPASDTNEDDFLSWAELFVAMRARVETLYGDASTTFSSELQQVIKVEGQTPAKVSLPKRIFSKDQQADSVDNDGRDGSPVAPPDSTRAVAVLNFTSVPSGAEVSINGFVVGQTPLMGYELDTDGRSTKDIEVTVKAEGYAEGVKKFKVRRGHPFTWEFTLTQDMPKTVTGRDNQIDLEQFIFKDYELPEGCRFIPIEEDEELPCGIKVNPFPLLILDRQSIDCFCRTLFGLEFTETLGTAIAILFSVMDDGDIENEYGIFGFQFDSEKLAQRAMDLLRVSISRETANGGGRELYLKGKVLILLWTDVGETELYHNLEKLIETRLKNLK